MPTAPCHMPHTSPNVVQLIIAEAIYCVLCLTPLNHLLGWQ